MSALDTVTCPRCKLRFVSALAALNGACTCPECGAQLDRRGEPVHDAAGHDVSHWELAR